MKNFLMLLMSVLLVGCNLFNSSKKIELIPFLQKDKYGYFDLEGKIVINPQFQYASAFRNGIALVKTTGDEGKWGYIDKDGKFVINATYKDATVFQEGIAWVVSENSIPTAIDPKGEIKFTLKDAENVRLFSDELAAFSKPDSTSTIWGFVDKSGNQVVSPQFTEVGDFSNDKCAVKNKEGKWGFIDKSGKIIINYQFDSAEKFVDGLLQHIRFADTVFYISKVKEFLIPQYVIEYSPPSSFTLFNTEFDIVSPPRLLVYTTWTPKDGIDMKVNEQRFTNYQQACEQLDKKKKLLVEYYYKKITEIRDIELKEI
jgi:hypothetical protein